MAGPRATPFSLIRYLLALVVILALGFWPLLFAVFAGVTAASNGCVLNPEGPVPCLIGGSDWGGLLYWLADFSPFIYVFVPLGLVALFGWLFSFSFNLYLSLKNRRSPVDPSL